MMKIVLLHPDLGIGGAERLMIDLAMSLKTQGHSVRIVTCHHDQNHCFEETKNGSLDIVVVGKMFPRQMFGRFHAICAYLQMLYAAFFVYFMRDFQPSLIFCDQVSVCIPVLKLLKAKIVFYCHFPDQLLASRNNWLKWFYRLPIDWLEEKTTGMADMILVNSEFTSGIFYSTFKNLQHVNVEVLYPSLSKMTFEPLLNGEQRRKSVKGGTNFLSINRYERKKNISLAIHAMGKLKTMVTHDQFQEVHLTIAGGYDERVMENVQCFSELVQEAEALDVLNQITFMKSPSDEKKRVLFNECSAVLYTPSNEHFGIVPLEAMSFYKPVIACNSGGPLETIIDDKTGFLCDPTPEAFAKKMKLFVLDDALSSEMGKAAALHVVKKFSFSAFTEKLQRIVNSCC